VSEQQPKKTRGRPRATDAESIGSAAFELFLERGFTDTTMADIAAAAGISSPTLFRYFSSKSAILWSHYAENVASFERFLQRYGAEVPVVDAVFGAYRSMLLERPASLPLIKARVALVSREADEVGGMWAHYTTWSTSIAAFLAGRTGGGADDLENVVVSGALWSGLWGAIVTWALSDEELPDAVLERARVILTL
jgi:AcrR family transcriptional regulator